MIYKPMKLGDVAQFKNGKKKPNSSGGIPVYGGNGIFNYTDQSNNENVIIIGRVGAYCGSVYYEENKSWVSDNAIAVSNVEGKSNIMYLKYLLDTLQLNERRIGTSQPLLTQNILKDIEVKVPKISTQIHISSLLSSFDGKIENNNAIIANLEEQAQTIFKSWFVNFEPFQDDEFVESELGEIPASWEATVLEDYLEIKYGKDHKKLSDGCYPVYGSGGVMRYVEDYLYKNESVLVPRKGTLNNVMYVNEPFWSVDTMFYTVMKQKNIAKFIYLFLKRVDLKSMNVGSAVPSMTTKILNNMKIIKPIENVLTKFESIVGPMFEKITQLQLENSKLAELRDTLLPKLMSGEIRVGDVDTEE